MEVSRSSGTEPGVGDTLISFLAPSARWSFAVRRSCAGASAGGGGSAGGCIAGGSCQSVGTHGVLDRALGPGLYFGRLGGGRPLPAAVGSGGDVLRDGD